MEIYYGTIFLLALFAFIEINLKQQYPKSEKIIKFLVLISFLILVLQMGLRWETGTDWEPYLDHFEGFKYTRQWFGNIDQFESGYELFAHTVYYLVEDYSFFLVLNAIIFYWLIIKANNYFSDYKLLSLLLFYSFSIGILGSNRQLMALGIGLISLKYLFEKKYIYYFLLIGLAYFFHATSILFLSYFFLNRTISNKSILFILCISIVIGKTGIPTSIFNLVGGSLGESTSLKTGIYLDNSKEELSNSALSLFGMFKRLFFLGIFIINRNKILPVFKKYNLLLNGYVIGVAFYFIFSESLLVMISRGSLYFNVMESFLLASQIIVYKDSIRWHLMYLILVLLSILNFKQSISAYPELFDPYIGIFYNSDVNRNTF